MRVVNIIKQRGYFLSLIVFLSSFIILCSQVQASMNNTNSSVEFLDNGRLTLNAKGVPLGTLLGKIQENTNLEFKIPENLFRKPIFVSFQSLPLNEAIRRILHGVNYACIFDSNGDGIITLFSSSKPKDRFFPKETPDRDFPYKVAEKIIPPPEMENMEDAMGFQPPPEMENIEDAMGIEPPPEGEDVEKAMGNMPPPEVEDLVKAMGFVPPTEKKNQ